MRSCGTNQSSSFYLSISFWVGSALATGQAGHWASRPATGKPTLDLRTQTPRQKQAKRTRLAHATNKPGKQTSWRAAHLSELARQLHAVQYFEPRAGHGAHVQSGTSVAFQSSGLLRRLRQRLRLTGAWRPACTGTWNANRQSLGQISAAERVCSTCASSVRSHTWKRLAVAPPLVPVPSPACRAARKGS